jgi:hypothetical protein
MTIGGQQPDSGVRQAEPSSSRGDSANVHLAGILVRLCAAIISRAPVGYEDETGFLLE